MNTRDLRRLAGMLVVACTVAAPLDAQSVGVSTFFQGYSFGKGLGADAAQLLMIPVAVRLPVGDKLLVDVYSAWAQGKVQRGDVDFTLSGPVDTQVKATLRPQPWALFSVGVNVPTGNATHTQEEAIVSSVLAADILGFREATFGTGLGITTSLATASRMGQWGVGIAGSYALRNEFEPTTDGDLRYQPGNEARVRVGLDRNLGTSGTFTAGFTAQSFTHDQANGKNLFQAGNRFRGDASFQFRAGAGVWTVYATDLWRDQGDLTLDIVDQTGVIVGDTTFTTSSQNLMAGGVIGAIAFGPYLFRPRADMRIQRRREGGNDQGSGWIASAGGDLPVRLFGAFDFFPSFRVLTGSIVDATGESRGLWGGEISATVRFGR